MKAIHDAIRQSNGDPLIINWTEITTTRLVGRCINIAIEGNRASFIFHDGTGHMEAHYWFGLNDESIDEFNKIRFEGKYAVIVGRVININGENYIHAFSCRIVTNPNEITHHFFQVIHVHLELKEKANSSMKKAHNAVTIASTSRAIVVSNNQNETKDTPINIVPPPITHHFKTGKKDIRGKVLSLIRELHQEGELEGVSILKLLSNLDVDVADLRAALIDLAAISEIYSTIDEEHYSAT